MPLLGRRNVASATGPDGNRGNRLSLMQTPPLGRARPRVGIGPRLRRALGFLTAKQGLRVSTRWSRPWRQGHMCKDPTAPLSMAWAIAHRDKRAHQRPPRSSAIRRQRGAGRAALSRRIVDGQRYLVALGYGGFLRPRESTWEACARILVHFWRRCICTPTEVKGCPRGHFGWRARLGQIIVVLVLVIFLPTSPAIAIAITIAMPPDTCNVNVIAVGITCAVAVGIAVSAALAFTITDITNGSGSSKPSLSARTIATISTYHPRGRHLHVHVFFGHFFSIVMLVSCLKHAVGPPHCEVLHAEPSLSCACLYSIIFHSVVMLVSCLEQDDHLGRRGV